MAHLAGQTGKYLSLKKSVKISWWLDTVPGLIYNITMNDFIFAVPISYTDLKLNTSELVSFAYDLKTKDVGNIKTNVGGWQSKPIDLKHLTLQPLCIEILKFVEDYRRLISFKKDLQITLENGWFNINGFKDYNTEHDHPKNDISGVYYLQSWKDSGGIVFYNPSDTIDWSWSNYKTEIYTNINSKEYTYQPIVNRLFLFPSWLKHSVQPNMEKNIDRISFSFNIKII